MIQGIEIFVFIGGLVLISDSFAPIASRYVAMLSNDAMFWGNILSAVLDNSTLVALEFHRIEALRARGALLSLLISGGMLIPGNIPNIVCANRIRIGSGEWARIGVPLGLAGLIVYFAVLNS